MMKRQADGLNRDRIDPELRQRLSLAVRRHGESAQERAERVQTIEQRGSPAAQTGRGSKRYGVPSIAESGKVEMAIDDELLRWNVETLATVRTHDGERDAILESLDVFEEEVDALVAVQTSDLNCPCAAVSLQDLDWHAERVRTRSLSLRYDDDVFCESAKTVAAT